MKILGSHWKFRKGEGYSARPAPPPPPFLRQASGQKDDVNGFSSTSDIFFMNDTQHPQPPMMPSTFCIVSALSCGISLQYYNSPIILVLSCQPNTIYLYILVIQSQALLELFRLHFENRRGKIFTRNFVQKSHSRLRNIFLTHCMT